jgi:serine/threonine protein kinase
LIMQNDEVIPDSVSDASASEANEPSVPAVQIETDAVTDYDCSHCGCKIDVSGLPAFTQVECPDCGAIETVPARLGNFLLLRLLGLGGMGGVYYARDTALGRDVAIKVMLQSLGDDAKFIETFRKEAQAVAKLNHPNIAQIYSFGQEKGQPYIVMELVSGERVDDMLESEGGIPVPLAMKIGLEVAEGLSAADEAGLVHGDIKPENILLDTKGHAKLVDFGLATVAHAAASDGIWGTPYYIAPEKIRRQKVDARADIYSLGATLFHMITGNPPFEGETPVEVVKARLEQPPPDIKELYPDIPDKAADVIMRMLAVDRTERHPN